MSRRLIELSNGAGFGFVERYYLFLHPWNTLLTRSQCRVSDTQVSDKVRGTLVLLQ